MYRVACEYARQSDQTWLRCRFNRQFWQFLSENNEIPIFTGVLTPSYRQRCFAQWLIFWKDVWAGQWKSLPLGYLYSSRGIRLCRESMEPSSRHTKENKSGIKSHRLYKKPRKSKATLLRSIIFIYDSIHRCGHA